MQNALHAFFFSLSRKATKAFILLQFSAFCNAFSFLSTSRSIERFRFLRRFSFPLRPFAFDARSFRGRKSNGAPPSNLRANFSFGVVIKTGPRDRKEEKIPCGSPRPLIKLQHSAVFLEHLGPFFKIGLLEVPGPFILKGTFFKSLF